MAQLISRHIPGQRWPQRPWNVLLGWCSLDGALLDVPTPATGEAIEDILCDLDHIVDDIKADRLSYGLSVDEAAPVCHTTDLYGRHKKELGAFYRSKFPEF